MQYVNVYGRKFSHDDKEFVFHIFSFIDVPKGLIKFVDLDIGKPDPNALINVCFDNTHTEFSRSLIDSGKFAAKDLLSGNVVNDDTKFMMFSIPISVGEIQATQANKQFTWEKLLQVKEYLYKYGYLETSAKEHVDESQSTTETEAADEQKESVSVVEEDVTPQGTEDTERSSGITVDVEEVLNRIVDELKQSDLALGKSLKLTEKVVFDLEDGQKMTVYPSNVIKDTDDGLKISFKDMIALIKMYLVVGATKMTFYNKG